MTYDPSYYTPISSQDSDARYKLEEEKRIKDEAKKISNSNIYRPDLKSSFNSDNEWLSAYGKSLGTNPSQIEDLSKGLTNVGAYKGVNWQEIQDRLQSEYNAPTYNSTNYDLNSQYTAPDPYQAYDFNAPTIENITDVQPVSDSIWEAQGAKSSEDIGNRYQDLRTQARDELIRTGKRPEQSAAILSNLGIKEEEARRSADRDLAIEKAKQGVGIAQQTQSLNAARGTAQAGLDASAQENMAKELATKYNMDVDAARYMVSNYIQENQLNSQENQTKYSIDTEAERYKSAQDQWAAEQDAAEKQKEYQSKYGLAQDVAQTKMADYQANQASKMDYWNALLQGGEAARTGAAQESTYWTNLTKEERAKAPAPTKQTPTAPSVNKYQPTVPTNRRTAMPSTNFITKTAPQAKATQAQPAKTY